ncbi:hypothetical protein [Aliivibrio sp. 1S128]|uniref:hypothetical protein n=1 Tax=Aliivibrio sp. 1S128 TaxID=1840085 RepID=UPI00080E0355|nr:hypothetical protein [Aliivibrio sp. 1S128]OCH22533.1 hypothetical protein A6E03_19400 [Aliivibrio sp. 1S128]
MKFKIANKLTKHKYLSPAIVLLTWPILISIGSFLLGDLIDLKHLSYVVLFSAMPAFINYRGRAAFLKYASTHFIEVTENGLISYEPDTEEIMKWDNIKLIKVKQSRGQIKSIKLVTPNSMTVDLSRYDDLDGLCCELKRFVELSRWK